MSATRLITPTIGGLVRSPAKGPLPSKYINFQAQNCAQRQFSSTSPSNRPQTSPLKAFESQQASRGMNQSFHNAIGRNSRRFYSSEMAGAMVEVSKNIGMGAGAIGLGGAGIGIGIVFSALLQGVARNPGMRGQLFTYAILGFAFVEAMGLLELVTALMIKFV